MEPARRLLLAALILGAAVAAVAGGVAWLRRPELPGDGLARVRRVIPAGERATVEVLNGTRRQGLARIGTRVLRRAGFDVMSFETGEAVDSTLVVVRRGRGERAEDLRELLGTGIVREALDSTRGVDYTVILGPDWQPPAGIIP